jgi:hypothetical protein
MAAKRKYKFKKDQPVLICGGKQWTPEGGIGFIVSQGFNGKENTYEVVDIFAKFQGREVTRNVEEGNLVWIPYYVTIRKPTFWEKLKCLLGK